jgi:hypothetical protein
MKIKITKCSDYLLWYNDLVGEVLKVERETIDHYWCRELYGFRCLNIVVKKDAVQVPEDTPHISYAVELNNQ